MCKEELVKFGTILSAAIFKNQLLFIQRFPANLFDIDSSSTWLLILFIVFNYQTASDIYEFTNSFKEICRFSFTWTLRLSHCLFFLQNEKTV